MKKLLLLALVALGGVMNASAWGDMYLVCGENDNWSISNNDADFKFTWMSTDNYKIIVPGSYVNSGNWYFRFREKDSDTWYNICPPQKDNDVNVTNTNATTTWGNTDYPKAFYVESNPNAKWVIISISWANSAWSVSGSYITTSNSVAFINPDNWNDVYAHAFVTESTVDLAYMGAWPGKKLTSNAGIYVAEVPVGSKIIFNNGNGGDGNQYPTSGGYTAEDNGVYDASGLKENVNTEVTAIGYATFSSAYPLDFENVSGLTAYTVDPTTSGNGVIKLVQVTGKVPAATGLLLKADGAANVNGPTAICTDNVSNMLVASVTSTELTGNSTNPYRYILAGTDAASIGFYYVNTTRTSGAGKAYLESTTNLAAAGARVSWIFADDDATAIEQVATTALANEVYDLQGRRVAQPTKGLYIVNGKKVVK